MEQVTVRAYKHIYGGSIDPLFSLSALWPNFQDETKGVRPAAVDAIPTAPARAAAVESSPCRTAAAAAAVAAAASACLAGWGRLLPRRLARSDGGDAPVPRQQPHAPCELRLGRGLSDAAHL